ncbi:MAG: NUDIX hydrolase [Gammaproteobacteria bacterium]|jgi:8-oxo-dGTP pyrophosphatase MutT (NUDIX family)
MSEKDSKDIKVERNPKINIQQADPSLPPSEPKPAATVLLVRTIEEAVEVFMIQRSIKTNFGGAWVFPGGKLDEYDLKDDINNYCRGLTDEVASQLLGVKSGGLNYWIACIRECFEECGVLLAYRSNGEVFGSSDESEKEILKEYRDKLNKGEPVLLELCQKLDLQLAVDRLAYISHWVTPKSEAKRYSTHFFIALFPEGQTAKHDGSEGVKSIWIKPEDALAQGEKGEFPIIFPTIKNLESIRGFTDTETLLKNKVEDQNNIVTVEPKIFMQDGKMVLLMPGDEGYDDH